MDPNTDTTEETTADVDNDAVDTDESPAIPQMRKRIKELEAQAKEADALRRENTLQKLGVDADDKQVKLFLKAEGDGLDWTDPEAVKAGLAEYDLYAPQGDGGSVSEDQRAEAQAHRQMSAAANSGSTQPVGGGPDYSQASTPDEVLEMARKSGATIYDGNEASSADTKGQPCQRRTRPCCTGAISASTRRLGTASPTSRSVLSCSSTRGLRSARPIRHTLVRR